MTKLKKKIWKIPVWLIIVFLGISVVSAAVMYTLRVPSTITILEPPAAEYEIKLYWDAECTTEVISFDFGEVKIGQTVSVIFHIKNLSNVTVDVNAFGQFSAYTYQFNDWQRGMASNEVREWTLSVLIPVMAEPGTYDFDMRFRVYPSSG